VVELADIFQQQGDQYRTNYGNRMLPSHLQAMRDVECCRTEALGGHVYSCPECDQVQYQYHSCRNRHCPKCQQGKGQEWLEKQQDNLLGVPYFLLTFTLPDDLRTLARSNQSLFYNTLFRTSAAAAKQLALDPKYVGGQIGMVGVLHTWGRDLTYHPHLHYLVPAGGIGGDGKWLPVRNNFLFPVKALSKIFRAKFRDALREDECFELIPDRVWKQDWVHCQQVGRGLSALKYLAPYIFRVAISNKRIVRFDGEKVTYLYKPTGTKKYRRCTLTAEEFIRRFLQHVLPRGFVKVRYYGFLSSAVRPKLLSLRIQLEEIYSHHLNLVQQADEDDPVMSDKHHTCCPSCGCPMQLQGTIPRNGRSPP